MSPADQRALLAAYADGWLGFEADALAQFRLLSAVYDLARALVGSKGVKNQGLVDFLPEYAGLFEAPSPPGSTGGSASLNRALATIREFSSGSSGGGG